MEEFCDYNSSKFIVFLQHLYVNYSNVFSFGFAGDTKSLNKVQA